ncbi:MAG: DNA ligase [Candidatus Bathyarchaeota archaeon BA1]|nr:MAG: DNA ligase [Candidatus Bathyarchaeota archaeon BA1]
MAPKECGCHENVYVPCRRLHHHEAGGQPIKVECMQTEFRALAELCERLESTSKRTLMVDWVADFLGRLRVDEVEPATSMILGRAFPKWDQRVLEVSWATLSGIIKRLTSVDWKAFSDAFGKTGDIGAATKIVLEASRPRRQTTLFEKPLTILEVRRGLEAIAETTGYGSRERKERLIETLLSGATPLETKYLVKIMIGEMRTGFHEGLMELAVSRAFGIPQDVVQTASMLTGDIGEVAMIAKAQGGEGVSRLQFQVFRPVKPMMAQTAEDVNEALKEHGGETALEYKLDGARIQIHKSDDKVRIYSRRLTDITESLPEVVWLVRGEVKAHEVILEGEVIAVGEDGSPLLFQHLMRRFRRVHEIDMMIKQIPIELYLFDLIYLDGQSLITASYLERRRKLAEIAGNIPLTRHMITTSPNEAERFLMEAIDKGHEGLVAKKLDSPYTPGVRGKRWFKIKRTLEPLDLVIVAAEYGYGRRHDWLSDYYLAARDTQTGELLIIGKTFKGLTDEEIIQMTQRLKESAIKEEHRRVTVIPGIVVEVAYNEIQKSPKYKSKMALRFARITRIRDDKSPEEADTIQRVSEIYEKQFEKKAKY